ncbi:LPXTG cell wall anchor domain-containing protein [uncultured Brevibacterium sp.]|uniref:LPXTG cell wall anchor domain-containing protein n=1 Tax=uncultured Brevibacterium sp. TaxID=189678 RepID=UPI0025F19637|nr:LPXTG cell wall anchor domain-containing protein [uncultured Brevibacterium sp.]
MKKLLLAPAVAVVAGSVAFTGPAAVATSATPNETPAQQKATDAPTSKEGNEGSSEPADENEKPSEPKLKITPKNISAVDFQDIDKTVTINITGLSPNEMVTYKVTKKGSDVKPWTKTLGSGPSGEVKENFTAHSIFKDLEDVTGEYTVTVTGSDLNLEETFTVTDDEASGPDSSKPGIAVEDTRIHVTPFRDKGFIVRYKNLEPGKKYTWNLKGGEAGVENSDTFTADKNSGSFYVEVASDTELDALLGNYTVTLDDENGKPVDTSAEFQVVKDDEQAGNNNEDKPRYMMSLDRPEISTKEFLSEDSGIQVGIVGMKPNEKFTYTVTKVDGDGKVEDFEGEGTADEEGRGGTAIHGVQKGQSAESFAGKYKITVKSEQGELTETFTVVHEGKGDDAEGGDGDGGDSGDTEGGSDGGSGSEDDAEAGDGSGDDSGAGDGGAGGDASEAGDLPRTGMGVTGLIAGGALLTVGAATVLVTRRRNK